MICSGVDTLITLESIDRLILEHNGIQSEMPPIGYNLLLS